MGRLTLKRPELFDPPDGSYLLGVGKQRFVGKLDRIWLTPKLAASHMLVVGQTGSGKSKLLESVCRQYLSSAQGFCLIDLHGDLATDLRDFAASLPDPERETVLRKLVWLDAGDPERTATFNPLAAAPEDQATQRLELVAAFRRQWAASWGPRLADLLTHSLAVLQANSLTLAEVPLLLGDGFVRDRLLAHPDVEPGTRDYFEFRFDRMSKRDQIMVSESTSNKVGAFLADSRVRTLLGDTDPTFSPRRAIQDGQVVLARIPRGVLVEHADLVASLLLAAFHTAALARIAEPPGSRTPYALVIDEAQVASDTFPQLLSGARAFGLAAVCGVQYLDLLPEKLVEALLANCRTRAAFRLSRKDAEVFARELFRADGDHIKHQESDLLGAKKSRPTYWTVQEEWEYAVRELQDQAAGECVLQLDRGVPWFAETTPVSPAGLAPGDLRRLRWRLSRTARPRTEISRAIELRRAHLTNQPTNDLMKGGDDYDQDDDAVEPLA
jgi:hypothetical protein